MCRLETNSSLRTKQAEQPKGPKEARSRAFLTYSRKDRQLMAPLLQAIFCARNNLRCVSAFWELASYPRCVRNARKRRGCSAAFGDSSLDQDIRKSTNRRPVAAVHWDSMNDRDRCDVGDA